MLGAMAGDVIGSAYEVIAVKTTYFQLFPPACFTDDTALNVGTAEALLGGGDYTPPAAGSAVLFPRRTTEVDLTSGWVKTGPALSSASGMQ